MATACWTFIVSKSPSRQAASVPYPGSLRPANMKVTHTLSTNPVVNLWTRRLSSLGGWRGRSGRLYRHSAGVSGAVSRPPRPLRQSLKTLWGTGLSRIDHPVLPGQRACGRITTYCAHSPRRTSTLKGRALSTFASMPSNWRVSATCTLATARMMSP